ncbi:MAG TPA: N-acetyl-alpha-D-glucosaminyl L-malate synthase BshA [Blastocatellia bacterium]|nr:N-acetyl-alpha-D-glucosaminyl L-malate synthase BshA [Blastocatellia bacterium]
MKIGITCYSTYGGSGIVGSELAKELALRGHTVHIIARSLPTRITELSDRIQFHEVEALNYPLFEAPHYSLALAVKMAEIGCREQLDLLHVHYAIPHSISGYLAREMLRGRKALPIVTTLHGSDITLVGSDRSYLAVTRFAIAESDGVTAISKFLAHETCSQFGLPDVRVIPNFVDVDFYVRNDDGALRERLAPNGERLLVHVSNFRPVKRIGDCIEIFARVRREVKSRLIMVGDGPDAGSAQALAEERGVASDVVFVGKQPKIADYLSVADVLLLPSETESFGLAALEAMSCEVPVVASRVGGLPEVVEDGVSGFLRPVGDVDAMAAAALALLGDESMARAFGIAARQSAVEKYTTDQIIPQYLSYYDEVLANFDPGHTSGRQLRYVR